MKRKGILPINGEEVCQRVAVGKRGWRTPIGNWRITDKIKNPGWTNFKTNRVVKPGKNNPLGTRWIEFWRDNKTGDSIGFHATNIFDSIGKDSTHGCVRMFPNDIEELYQYVDIDTPVRVVD
jgi:lipoprotein-anchoring transpeptidase ErfK/SrfK